MSKFVKGDPRINRKGRPKKGDTVVELLEQLGGRKPVSEAMLKHFKEYCPDEEPTLHKVVLLNLILRAANGEGSSVREYFNRLVGLPRQTIEHSGHVLNNLQDILTLAEYNDEDDRDED